jgi:hypothetical protein
MDYSIEEIQPNVWRVNVASITRIIRYRSDSQTFAPWDVTSADGRKLWSASSLESAFRWIQAHTGHPTEALFAEALLERNAMRSSTAEVRLEPAEITRDRRAVGN